jgi:signal transduction histidine kinase
MRVIHEKADALDRLVADLFAYTRIEYLEQALRREPLELGAVLRRAVEGLQPLAEAQGVGLMLADPSEDCPLEGDEHLLERAVANLLDNALRYTPAGGRIEVSWEARPDRATFAVADSGPGIEPQDLPHLFEPLYRGEASRSPETGGAGLGLAVARRILRAHGGDLTAANRASGGAEFAGWVPRPAPSPPARLVAETGGHRRG